MDAHTTLLLFCSIFLKILAYFCFLPLFEEMETAYMSVSVHAQKTDSHMSQRVPHCLGLTVFKLNFTAINVRVYKYKYPNMLDILQSVPHSS